MDLKAKWEHDYIEDLDLTQIEWIKLNSEQLREFYRVNYWDKDAWEWVHGEKANSLSLSPIGLHYLCYDSVGFANGQFSFLLGVVNNKVGKKTIVAAMMYLDSYFLYDSLKKPVTYISSIETNSYFRNKELCQQLCDVIIKFINPEQHVATSRPSEIGEKLNLFEKLKNALIKNGFKKMIGIDDWQYRNELEQLEAKLKTLGTMPK